MVLLFNLNKLGTTRRNEKNILENRDMRGTPLRGESTATYAISYLAEFSARIKKKIIWNEKKCESEREFIHYYIHTLIIMRHTHTNKTNICMFMCVCTCVQWDLLASRTQYVHSAYRKWLLFVELSFCRYIPPVHKK